MGVNETLTSLKVGEQGKVMSLLATGTIRRRLLDLGIIEGTQIVCLQKSPAKDPIAFFIRGAVIALRSEDSNNILVSTVNAYDN